MVYLSGLCFASELRKERGLMWQSNTNHRKGCISGERKTIFNLKLVILFSLDHWSLVISLRYIWRLYTWLKTVLKRVASSVALGTWMKLEIKGLFEALEPITSHVGWASRCHRLGLHFPACEAKNNIWFYKCVCKDWLW